MKETAKIVEAAKQVAEVLVNNRITYAEVNRVFRETERHLSLATNAETTRTRAPYSRFPAESAPESDTENIPAWLKAEREKWRRFELTAEDFTQIAELNAIIERHGLSRRELAVITASLRLRPEFTFADFSPNQSAANLSGYATVDLATELKRRDGVESVCLEPYASATMKMEGPATVLKVFV